jgi:copper homeostasis protein
VIGFLRDRTHGKRIDHELLKGVLTSGPGLKATFHRAFEELADPLAAIAELKQHPQIDRILTSGGRESCARKVDRLTAWQHAARPEVELVIGGGTDAEVIRQLKPHGIREFHVGTAVREGRRIDGPVLADYVRALAELIH